MSNVLGVSPAPLYPRINAALATTRDNYRSQLPNNVPMEVQRAVAARATQPANAAGVTTAANYQQYLPANAAGATTAANYQQYLPPASAAPVAYTTPVVDTAPQVAQVTGSFSGTGAHQPLQSSTNTHLMTPTYGVTVGDAGNAARDFGAQYAAVLATGQAPVVDGLTAMYLNRLRAQGDLAHSAATKAADANAVYRAMNDPDTRNRAQAIATSQGISLDTALKQALAGTLTEQGNLAALHTYEGGTLIPAMERENARRVTLGLEAGIDTPALTNFDGNIYQSQGVNSVYNAGDGQLSVNTAGHNITGDANTAATVNRLMASSAPQADAYALRQQQVGGLQNRANAVTQAAQNRISAANAATKQQMAATDSAVKTQIDAMREARLGTTAPKQSTPSQQLNALINAVRVLPKDDPRRAQAAQQLLQQHGVTLE